MLAGLNGLDALFGLLGKFTVSIANWKVVEQARIALVLQTRPRSYDLVRV
jgi:hypothetical protein